MRALIISGCALCLFFGVIYVLLMRKGGSARALITKSLASLCFFLTGALCAFGYTFATFDLLVLLGLFFGMVADAVFGARFIAKKKPARFFVSGALLFAVGHGFYIAAFNLLKPVAAIWYIAAALVAVVVFFSGKYLLRMHYGRLWPLILLYCLVIGVMLFSALAVSDLLHPGRRILLAIAAFLFSFSDLVLLYTTFVKKPTLLHFFNICPYYAGQLLFAISMVFIP